MKKTYYILSVGLMFSVICSCQSEISMTTTQPARKITARAYLPNNDETRAQVTYGNPDKDKEIFKWKVKDYFYVFNLSKISEWDDTDLQLEIKDTADIKGSNAVFESVGTLADNIRIEKGDTILLVFGGEARRYQPVAGYFDERNIFSINAGTQGNKPQVIVSNPDDSSLNYMSENLLMYDIVIAEENDNLPDLHFKLLSTFIRVTLHNETGEDLYPTNLEVRYPTKSPAAVEEDAVDRDPSFFNTTLYCSVELDDNAGHYLKVYDSDEFFKSGSLPYSDKVSTTLNLKDNTTDVGESIKNGESYELYLTPVPRIGNDSSGDKLTILLTKSHDTDNQYSITLDNFNTVIEAGKRYWFNLTATPAGDLVLTSKYNPEDYD